MLIPVECQNMGSFGTSLSKKSGTSLPVSRKISSSHIVEMVTVISHSQQQPQRVLELALCHGEEDRTKSPGQRLYAQFDQCGGHTLSTIYSNITLNHLLILLLRFQILN